MRQQAAQLGIAGQVVFSGFLQAEELAKALGGGLALLLPSLEEQFGLAIIEALTLGVPVIVSDACGARDGFVRSGINGFVVEPDNALGLARFMLMLERHPALWNDMAAAAYRSAEHADVARFVEAVQWHLDH